MKLTFQLICSFFITLLAYRWFIKSKWIKTLGVHHPEEYLDEPGYEDYKDHWDKRVRFTTKVIKICFVIVSFLMTWWGFEYLVWVFGF